MRLDGFGFFVNDMATSTHEQKESLEEAILRMGALNSYDIFIRRRNDMEFIFELIFEIIFEGTLELFSHKKVPMPLRILAVIVFLTFYAVIILALMGVAYEALQDGKIAVAVLFFIVSAGLAVGCIYMVVKKYRENRRKNNKER